MENQIELSELGKTWLLDLDGTILKHNGYKEQGDEFLKGAKKFLLEIPIQDKIIFLTSRKEEAREVTEAFLSKEGVRYDEMIFNLPYGERILMNDRKESGLKTAIAVNTKRNVFCESKFVVNEAL